MANVRAATHLDLASIIALGKRMHAEAPALKHAPFDEGKVQFALSHALTSGCILVHETAEEIDGYFIGIVVERWFSRAKMACDLALYVRPDRRGGLIAWRLLDGYLFWCKTHGLPARDVQVSISTGAAVDATGRLFERLGFEPIGGNYQLRSYS